jgi:hypothetical protein
VDQVILSCALRSTIPSDVLCGLHRAIVTSVLFPAGAAILPHALRILERDSMANVAMVKVSAVCALAKIETVVHTRLPGVKPPIISKSPAEEDEEDSESGIEIGNPPVLEDYHHRHESPSVNTGNGPLLGDHPLKEHRTSSIPSFPEIREELIRPSIPNIPPPVYRPETEATLEALNMSLGIKPRVTEVKDMETAKGEGKEGVKKDIFSMGGWKGVQTADVEEDEEMPEIDMGFDSDEE